MKRDSLVTLPTIERSLVLPPSQSAERQQQHHLLHLDDVRGVRDGDGDAGRGGQRRGRGAVVGAGGHAVARDLAGA